MYDNYYNDDEAARNDDMFHNDEYDMRDEDILETVDCDCGYCDCEICDGFACGCPDCSDCYDDEPYEMSDVEADADTLASAGWGTDEDYGCYGEY